MLADSQCCRDSKKIWVHRLQEETGWQENCSPFLFDYKSDDPVCLSCFFMVYCAATSERLLFFQEEVFIHKLLYKLRVYSRLQR